MKKLLWPLLCLLLSSCSKPSSPEAVGRAYYANSNCRTCHRVGAEGGVSGPDLTFAGVRHPAAWTSLWLQDPSGWRPGSPMPDPRLSREAREAIARYLASLKGQDLAGAKPWNDAPDAAARGRVIYQRAGCAGCHGRGGAGGFPNRNVVGGLVPALAAVSRTYNKEELVRKLKAGSLPAKLDAAGPEPMAMPAWGQVFSDAELADLADYLLSLKAKADAELAW